MYYGRDMLTVSLSALDPKLPFGRAVFPLLNCDVPRAMSPLMAIPQLRPERQAFLASVVRLLSRVARRSHAKRSLQLVFG